MKPSNSRQVFLKPGESFTGIVIRDNDQDWSFDVVHQGTYLSVWLPNVTQCLTCDRLSGDSIPITQDIKITVLHIGYTDGPPDETIPMAAQDVGNIFHLTNAHAA